MKRTLACGCAALAAAGCTTETPPGMVAIDWSCRIRELQIYPTFPPREDVQVGDIFLRRPTQALTQTASQYCKGQGRKDFVSIVTHLGSLAGTREALQAHYQSRIDSPSTPKTGVSIGQDGKVSTTGYAMPEVASDSLYASTNLKRSRMVGFPDFMAIRVTGADLGAIVPILGVMSRIGLGVESVESASISVPVAESYGVPAAWVLDALREALPSNKENKCRDKLNVQAGGKQVPLSWTNLETLAPLDRDEQAFATADGSGAARDKLYLSLVTEVFMTRAIDASVSFRQSAVAGLQRDREAQAASAGAADEASAAADAEANPADAKPSGAASTGKDQAGAPAGDQLGAPAKADASKPAAGSAGLPGESVARARGAAVAAAVSAALAARNAIPGVTLNLRSASGRGVGLTRIFDRPVVIGYRAVNLEVSRSDQVGTGGDNCMNVAVAPGSVTNQAASGGASKKDE